jgi:hypothetical protein
MVDTSNELSFVLPCYKCVSREPVRFTVSHTPSIHLSTYKYSAAILNWRLHSLRTEPTTSQAMNPSSWLLNYPPEMRVLLYEKLAKDHHTKPTMLLDPPAELRELIYEKLFEDYVVYVTKVWPPHQ